MCSRASKGSVEAHPGIMCQSGQMSTLIFDFSLWSNEVHTSLRENSIRVITVLLLQLSYAICLAQGIFKVRSTRKYYLQKILAWTVVNRYCQMSFYCTVVSTHTHSTSSCVVSFLASAPAATEGSVVAEPEPGSVAPSKLCSWKSGILSLKHETTHQHKGDNSSQWPGPSKN